MGDITIQMPPPIRVDLKSFGFLLYGRDFFEAAGFRGRERSVVPYFLYCQAIELGLKAFLLWKGMTVDELSHRPYGHNLAALLAEACRRDLDVHVSFSIGERQAIETGTSFYDSGPSSRRRFQYFDVMLVLKDFKSLPDLQALATAAAKLVADKALEDAYLDVHSEAAVSCTQSRPFA
jgi:hypothetical protein